MFFVLVHSGRQGRSKNLLFSSGAHVDSSFWLNRKTCTVARGFDYTKVALKH
jgi:hypothetical protein